MRHLLRFGSVLALCIAVSGCFLSRTPLVPPDAAAFPYTRIVFQVDDRSDDPQVLERAGDAYRIVGSGPTDAGAIVRLKAVADRAWVAQLSAPPEAENEDDIFLYALLVASEDLTEVSAYRAMKPDDFAGEPGLDLCADGVCIADLDAYATYAMAEVAAGAPPDTVYRLLELE